MSDFELDARRLLCPMPVIRTQNRIAELDPGDQLTVHCTDPGVMADIPAWCRIHGHQVVNTKHVGTEITVTIRVR